MTCDLCVPVIVLWYKIYFIYYKWENKQVNELKNFAIKLMKMGPIKRQFYDLDNRTYNVVISGFVQKMRSWDGSNKIFTNEFVVDGIKLHLQIYPNYGTDDMLVFLSKTMKTMMYL